ncbi:hypothetical protein ACJQWK_01672 [Exserohilum turcicum]
MRLFLVTLALAIAVMAGPHLHRRQPKIVYETEVVIQTVVVTLTHDYTTLGSTSLATSSTTELKAISTQKSDAQPEPTSTSSAWEIDPTASASVMSDAASDIDGQVAVGSSDHISGIDQAYLATGPDYKAAILFHHNVIRANHHAAPLSWDSKCEENARIAANRCNFEHFIPKGAGQGQNLFTVSGRAFNVTAAITESWYHGELSPMMPWFGKASLPHDVFEKVGHLTQLVWKGTTKVGCVSLDCGTAMTVDGRPSTMNKYTVCNYAPAGNVVGKYAVNVVPPQSTNAIGWAD